MNVRALKMADACAISGYTRDQMRALLRDIPSFTSNVGSGKNRIFTKVELLTIAIISFMEQRYGVKRTAIRGIVHNLVSALQSPREVDPSACLIIITGKNSVSYSRLSEAISEGLVIPLAPVFDRIDIYLGTKAEQHQFEISFKPSIFLKS